MSRRPGGVPRHVFCTIVPPHVLQHIAEHGSEDQRRAAAQSMLVSERIRGQRDVLALFPVSPTPIGRLRRSVFDAQNRQRLPGRLVRGEADSATDDVAVTEAFDASGLGYAFLREAFGRNSIDDRGMELLSTVHFGVRYDNAFWNGQQMVYGDGDGELFQRFTACIDIVGHELTHGVTEHEAGLVYQDQSGALNEHASDVVGVLLKQWTLGQTAAEADWLIGAGLLSPRVNGVALRSMKDPGSAYDDPVLGKDPQPGHMKEYVETFEDNGGVHINSGIPNRAFYLAAVEMQGHAWERAGKIWYVALRDVLKPESTFRDAAEATTSVAASLFGAAEEAIVRTAWEEVGVL